MTKKIWQSCFTHQDVIIESRTTAYDGHFTLDKLVIRFKKFNGDWTGPVHREQISRGNAAAVLLYDPKKDKVILVEQLRIGCIQDDSIESPWLLELVAGLVYPGESSIGAITREAQEEAGVMIEQVALLHEYYNTPGALTEKTAIYCALIDSSSIGGIFGLEEEHEDIQVHVLPFEEVFSQLINHQLQTSASTVMALQWLKLNREFINKQVNN